MKTIAISRADGGVSVMRVIDDKTDVAKEVAKAVPNAVSWQALNDNAIPRDRTFRNAWKPANGRIDHDLPKARELLRDRLREHRRPLMADLDGQYAKADEAGDVAEKQRVAGERQKLRDLPQDPRIEQAQSVEALKALLPR